MVLYPNFLKTIENYVILHYSNLFKAILFYPILHYFTFK